MKWILSVLPCGQGLVAAALSGLFPAVLRVSSSGGSAAVLHTRLAGVELTMHLSGG